MMVIAVSSSSALSAAIFVVASAAFLGGYYGMVELPMSNNNNINNELYPTPPRIVKKLSFVRQIYLRRLTKKMGTLTFDVSYLSFFDVNDNQ